MKAIQSQFIITSISSKKDGSLGLRIETPELSSTEKISFMELQGKNITGVLSPVDEKEEGIEKVNKELGSKTQSQRIRSVLYILYLQDSEGKSWENYYQESTDKIIEWLKTKIDA